MKITVTMGYEVGADIQIVRMKFKNMVNALNIAKVITEPFEGPLDVEGMNAITAWYEVK